MACLTGCSGVHLDHPVSRLCAETGVIMFSTGGSGVPHRGPVSPTGSSGGTPDHPVCTVFLERVFKPLLSLPPSLLPSGAPHPFSLSSSSALRCASCRSTPRDFASTIGGREPLPPILLHRSVRASRALSAGSPSPRFAPFYLFPFLP